MIRIGNKCLIVGGCLVCSGGGDNKKFVTHQEIRDRCQIIANQISKRFGQETVKIYGVPRGGVPIAYAVASFLPNSVIIDDVDQCDVVVDDVVDSGATKQRYAGKGVFYSAFDKLENIHHDCCWLVFPWEKTESESIEDTVIRHLQYIGEDVGRQGLQETPARVVKSWRELYKGYTQREQDIFKYFDSDGYNQIILLKDIELFSMCEHHMLPFFGKAHIAYIPNSKVIGISKLARLLDVFARRLQIQERIGEQVCDSLMKYLQPLGAACIIEAEHLCMRMRGVTKQGSTMVTSSLRGVFFDDVRARAELMTLLKSGGG